MIYINIKICCIPGTNTLYLNQKTQNQQWKKPLKWLPVDFGVDFPSGASGKEPACKAGDMGSIRGSRRSSGGGSGNPLQYSCLENPTDRGAWWGTHAMGHKELNTT